MSKLIATRESTLV